MKKIMMSVALSAMLVVGATGCQATNTTASENGSETTTVESTVEDSTSKDQSEAESTSASEATSSESDANKESESSEEASSAANNMVSENAQLFTEESFKTFVEENSDKTFIIFNNTVFDVTELEVKTDADGKELESGKDYSNNLSDETLMSIATATVVGALQE